MNTSTPEQKVMKPVVKWLNDHGIFWINIKTMGTWDARLNAYRKSPYTMRGTSDLLVIHQSQPIFIELKSFRGRQSADQKLFEKIIHNEGCEYYVVHNVKELQAIFPDCI
jgi:hypothetical protein